MQPTDELEELRISLERIRALLENIVVRGLRACGPDELTQLRSYAEHLEQTGAGHLASMLSDLHGEIERDERTSPRKLLETQTNVRLLERLLTLRVVKGHYANAITAMEEGDSEGSDDVDLNDDGDEADEE
jgi:hypothetical protein